MRTSSFLCILLACGCQRGSSEKGAGGGAEARDEPAPGSTAVATVGDAGHDTPPRGIPEASAAEIAPGRADAAPWLAGAERVAAFSSDRGAVRIVAAGTGWLRLLTADGRKTAEVGGVGAAQVLEVVDLNRDGKPAVVIGRGVSRDARNAPASVFVHWPERFSPGEEIPLPTTSRAQIIGVAGDPLRPGELYVGTFVSKYDVAILRARRSSDGTWNSDVVVQKRMAWALSTADLDDDGETEIAVARVYGDTRDAAGDLLLLSSAEKEEGKRIPSFRGVRSVITAPTQDGRPCVLYSDGWHRQYRKHALALLSRATWRDAGWQTEVLANVQGHYSYERLRIGDLDGDGARELIAVGNGPAVRVALDAPSEGHASALGGRDALDAFPVDLDGDGADEVLLVGLDPTGGGRAPGWVWRTVEP